MKYQSSIRISNSSQAVKTLILEPWGEEFEMVSGKVFEFFAKAEQEGSFEVQVSADKITVYLWESATVKIFCDGEELEAENFERQIVPNVPEGQSISSFLGDMFGRHE